MISMPQISLFTPPQSIDFLCPPLYGDPANNEHVTSCRPCTSTISAIHLFICSALHKMNAIAHSSFSSLSLMTDDPNMPKAPHTMHQDGIERGYQVVLYIEASRSRNASLFYIDEIYGSQWAITLIWSRRATFQRQISNLYVRYFSSPRHASCISPQWTSQRHDGKLWQLNSH